MTTEPEAIRKKRELHRAIFERCLAKRQHEKKMEALDADPEEFLTETNPEVSQPPDLR